MRILIPLMMLGCGGGGALQDLPAPDRAPVCREFGAAPSDTFGCTPDQIQGHDRAGGRTFTGTLYFGPDGTLDRFLDLREKVEITEAAGRAPDCLIDEFRGWRIAARASALSVPVAVTYTIGPTDFRESSLRGPACSVRITFESR